MLRSDLATVAGVSRDVSFIADTRALPSLLSLVAIAAVLTWWLRRSGRTRQPVAPLFAALTSIALILAATLLRDGWPARFDLGGVGDWSSDGYDLLRSDPFGSSQFLLNVALFVPAGALWTWLTRRPWRVAGTLALGSLVVELIQGITWVGAPDVADLAANSLGATLGAGAAAVGLRVSGATVRPQSRHRRVTVWIAASCAAAALIAALFVGAARHQGSIERELEARFAGTTLDDIERWTAEDRMFEEVFDAISVFSSGARYAPGEATMRWPASFFGLRRCVFVTWTVTDVRFERASGGACTDFIG